MKKGCVLVLRFPKFREAEEWDIKPLGDIGENLDSKRIPITEKDRVKGNIPYYGASGIIDYVNEFIFDEELLCISEDGANLVARTYPIAFSISGKTWVNNHAHVLKFKNSFTKLIIENYLNSISLDDYLTGMAQPKLNRGQLDIIPIPLPKDDGEQQKIADCLSSIDELITAQAQKVEALKTHKKGLMQQLFPAEGEAVPKLRFPEFREAGEWEEFSFGKLIKVNSGKGFKAAEYSKIGIRLLQIENVGYGITKWTDNTIYLPQSYLVEHPELVLREGNIVLALNRPVTNNELKIARLKKDDEPSLLYQRVGKLELLAASLVDDFIFQICRIFIKDFVDKQSIGSDQPFISIKDLYAQKILIPSPLEQQKIATCLSSLDELITAQTQKLNFLKTHKKGLMQLLFPSTNDTN